MESVLLKHTDKSGSHAIDYYMSHNGYAAAKKALALKPDEIIDIVTKSGLRGRGGAGFPTGMKWGFIPKQSTKPRYLVVNGDESEPGSCKDRVILLKDPHAVIEGIIIAAYSIGAKNCYVYIRGELLESYQIFYNAVQEAYKKNFLGKSIFGTDYSLDVTVHRGAGAYICGEETALLNSLEGKRGYPRIRPPFPAVEGFMASPTIVNNVQTIANIPHIINNGPDWFRQWGTQKTPGLIVYSISGHVKKPGLYELPAALPLRTLIYEYGGGILNDKKLKGVIPGGSSSGVLTADEIDIPLDFESLQAKGLILGTASVIVMHEDTCMVDALWNISRFYHHESCGQCTPCREGTGWLEKIIERIEKGQGESKDLNIIIEASNAMISRTICVLADSIAVPAKHFINKYRSEFEVHISSRRCPFKTAIR